MTTKIIQELQTRCQRLDNALRKCRSLLAAARRRAAKRESDNRDRRCLALGAATEAAIINRWPPTQTRLFLDTVTRTYPDDLSRSLRGLTEAGWISTEAMRTRRMRWGTVTRTMLLQAQIPGPEFELVVRSHLQPPQLGYALAAICDANAEFRALAANMEFWLPPPPDKEQQA